MGRFQERAWLKVRHELNSAAWVQQIEAGVPCCERLQQVLAEGRFGLYYVPALRSVRLFVLDGGGADLAVRFCPFCGQSLPRELEDIRYEIVEDLGLLPSDLSVSLDEHLADVGERGGAEQFVSDRWWRERIKADPGCFDVVPPEPGSVLALPEIDVELLVIAVRVATLVGEEMLVVSRRPGQDWLGDARVVSAWRASTGQWPVIGHDLEAARAYATRPIPWAPIPGLADELVEAQGEWRTAEGDAEPIRTLSPVHRFGLTGLELVQELRDEVSRSRC